MKTYTVENPGRGFPKPYPTVTSDYAGYLGSVSVASGTGWSAVAPDKAEPGTHIFLLGPPTGTMILIQEKISKLDIFSKKEIKMITILVLKTSGKSILVLISMR